MERVQIQNEKQKNKKQQLHIAIEVIAKQL